MWALISLLPGQPEDPHLPCVVHKAVETEAAALNDALGRY
jgi:hypothetical protein